MADVATSAGDSSDGRLVALDAVVASIAASLCGALLLTADGHAKSGAAYLALAMLACASLVWRRRWPRAVFVGVAIVSVMIAVDTGQAVQMAFASAVAAHGLAYGDSERERTPWFTWLAVTSLAACVSIALLGHSVVHDSDFRGPVFHFGLHFCLLASAAITGSTRSDGSNAQRESC